MFSRSPVRTVAGTRLAALIGESADAPCYHHQAIDEVGAGLVVSAWDPDGVVEAVLGLDDRPQAKPHFRLKTRARAAASVAGQTGASATT